MPPHCAETSLDDHGIPRSCALEAGHEGDHMGWDATTWEPPGEVLARLRQAWGRTHRIVWIGRMWMATAHDRRTHHRTEIEPTPLRRDQPRRPRHPPVLRPGSRARG